MDKKEASKILGQNIQKIRQDKKISQKELAKIVGVAEITIRQYETGKRQPDIGQLSNLALALNVTIGDLLGIDNLQSMIQEPSAVSDEDKKLGKEMTQAFKEAENSTSFYNTLIENMGYTCAYSTIDGKDFVVLSKENIHYNIEAEEISKIKEESESFFCFKIESLIKEMDRTMKQKFDSKKAENTSEKVYIGRIAAYGGNGVETIEITEEQMQKYREEMKKIAARKKYNH